MINVTIDTGSELESYDLKVINRIVGGLLHLEKEGFHIEDFRKLSGEKTQKRILVITYPEAVFSDGEKPKGKQGKK